MSSAVFIEGDAGLTPPGREVWGRACRYELRHLVALRSTWILLGIVALLAVWPPVAAPFIVESSKDMTDPALVDSLQWSPGLTQMPVLGFYLMVLGTGPVSAELMRGAARTTWLTAPSRSHAFWSKCLVGAAIGVVVSVATAVLEVGGLSVVAAAKGVHQPLWGQLGAATLRLAVWMACWMVLCTSVSALVRNRVGPVLVLFLVPALGERIIMALSGQVPGLDLSAVGDWLPFAAGRAMLSDGATHHGILAGLVFGAFTAVVAAAGHAAYVRRAG
ncbi:hypothetical protein [Streptomyces sp. L2]|uniref:hypothetical protein n=1 Tax=Streptomyces sp. L2 TaxID=2162665 RepID=UPI0010103C70|nr:hypothetical protein [Streptomyces sp. L2]